MTRLGTWIVGSAVVLGATAAPVRAQVYVDVGIATPRVQARVSTMPVYGPPVVYGPPAVYGPPVVYAPPVVYHPQVVYVPRVVYGVPRVAPPVRVLGRPPGRAVGWSRAGGRAVGAARREYLSDLRRAEAEYVRDVREARRDYARDVRDGSRRRR